MLYSNARDAGARRIRFTSADDVWIVKLITKYLRNRTINTHDTLTICVTFERFLTHHVYEPHVC